MAVKADDLYKHDLAELASLFVNIQSGQCEPYIGAVVAQYKKYLVKGDGWSSRRWERVSCRYRPFVYAVDGRRFRTVHTTRRQTWLHEYNARYVVQQTLQELGGVMFQGTLRNSLHNMPLSVMAAGLNEINIPGPSF